LRCPIGLAELVANTNDLGPAYVERALCSSSIAAVARGSGSVAFDSSVLSGTRSPVRLPPEPEQLRLAGADNGRKPEQGGPRLVGGGDRLRQLAALIDAPLGRSRRRALRAEQVGDRTRPVPAHVPPSEAEYLVGDAEHRRDVRLAQALAAQLADELHAMTGFNGVEPAVPPPLERVGDRVRVRGPGAGTQLGDGASQPAVGRLAEPQPGRRGDPFALAACAEDRVAFRTGPLDPDVAEGLPALLALGVPVAEFEGAVRALVDVRLDPDPPRGGGPGSVLISHGS
jgi:hypothetical protein